MNIKFNKKAHWDKAQHNQAASAFLGQDTDDYRDWQVTTTFYAAIHLLQGYFSNKTRHYPQTHQERDELIATSPDLSPIWSSYRELKRLSVSTRYLCLPTNSHDVNESLSLLGKIREHVERLT